MIALGNGEKMEVLVEWSYISLDTFISGKGGGELRQGCHMDGRFLLIRCLSRNTLCSLYLHVLTRNVVVCMRLCIIIHVHCTCTTVVMFCRVTIIIVMRIFQLMHLFTDILY